MPVRCEAIYRQPSCPSSFTRPFICPCPHYSHHRPPSSTLCPLFTTIPLLAVIRQSLYGLDAHLSGGAAKGKCFIAYAKDLTHIDALCDVSGTGFNGVRFGFPVADLGAHAHGSVSSLSSSSSSSAPASASSNASSNTGAAGSASAGDDASGASSSVPPQSSPPGPSSSMFSTDAVSTEEAANVVKGKLAAIISPHTASTAAGGCAAGTAAGTASTSITTVDDVSLAVPLPLHRTYTSEAQRVAALAAAAAAAQKRHSAKFNSDEDGVAADGVGGGNDDGDDDPRDHDNADDDDDALNASSASSSAAAAQEPKPASDPLAATTGTRAVLDKISGAMGAMGKLFGRTVKPAASTAAAAESSAGAGKPGSGGSTAAAGGSNRSRKRSNKLGPGAAASSTATDVNLESDASDGDDDDDGEVIEGEDRAPEDRIRSDGGDGDNDDDRTAGEGGAADTGTSLATGDGTASGGNHITESLPTGTLRLGLALNLAAGIDDDDEDGVGASSGGAGSAPGSALHTPGSGTSAAGVNARGGHHHAPIGRQASSSTQLQLAHAAASAAAHAGGGRLRSGTEVVESLDDEQLLQMDFPTDENGRQAGDSDHITDAANDDDEATGIRRSSATDGVDDGDDDGDGDAAGSDDEDGATGIATATAGRLARRLQSTSRTGSSNSSGSGARIRNVVSGVDGGAGTPITPALIPSSHTPAGQLNHTQHASGGVSRSGTPDLPASSSSSPSPSGGQNRNAGTTGLPRSRSGTGTAFRATSTGGTNASNSSGGGGTGSGAGSGLRIGRVPSRNGMDHQPQHQQPHTGHDNEEGLRHADEPIAPSSSGIGGSGGGGQIHAPKAQHATSTSASSSAAQQPQSSDDDVKKRIFLHSRHFNWIQSQAANRMCAANVRSAVVSALASSAAAAAKTPGFGGASPTSNGLPATGGAGSPAPSTRLDQTPQLPLRSPSALTSLFSAEELALAEAGQPSLVDSLMLTSFLVPSPASIVIAPLLHALYSRIPDVVATAVEALTAVVQAGFFMRNGTSNLSGLLAPPSQQLQQANGGSSSADDAKPPVSIPVSAIPDTDPITQTAMTHAAAWNLLDVVVACVVDATLPLLNTTSEPLMQFFLAILALASAGPVNNGLTIVEGPGSASRGAASQQQAAAPAPQTSKKAGKNASATGTAAGTATRTSSSGAINASLPPTAALSSSSTGKPVYLPTGFHPATLHRLLNTAMTSHVFMHMKCVYSERAWYYTMSMARKGITGPLSDSRPYDAKYREATRQAATVLYALKQMIQGVMRSLERDSAIHVDISVAEAALGITHPALAWATHQQQQAQADGGLSPAFSPSAGGGGAVSPTFGMAGQGGVGGAFNGRGPLSVQRSSGSVGAGHARHRGSSSGGFGIGSTATATTPSSSSSSSSTALPQQKPQRFVNDIRRSRFSDYTYLSRSYGGHNTSSAALCAEMQVACTSSIIHRPYPDLPPSVICPFDAFAPPNRSPTADIVVLLSYLCKHVAEPMSFPSYEPVGLGASIINKETKGSKIITEYIKKDTALCLLVDTFDSAGQAFASSPLLTGMVSRLACPALLTHAMMPRALHPSLSMAFRLTSEVTHAGSGFDAWLHAAADAPVATNEKGSGSSGSSSSSAGAANAAGGSGAGAGGSGHNGGGSSTIPDLRFIPFHGPSGVNDKYVKLFENICGPTGCVSAAALSRNPAHVRLLGGAHLRQGLGLAIIKPATGLRAVLRVVGAMWASKGTDDDSSNDGGNGNGNNTGSGAGASPAGFNASSSSAAAAGLGPVSSVAGLPTSIREACAREITALARALLLHTLTSKTAPPAIRLDCIDELQQWVAAPQLLMELYINHDMYPSTACPYPHMRFLRSVVATLVNTACCLTRRGLSGSGSSVGSALQSVGSSSSLAVNDAPFANGGGDGGTGMISNSVTGSGNIFGVDVEAIALAGAAANSAIDLSTASPAEKAIALDAHHRQELCKAAASLVASIVRSLMDSAATVHMSTSSSSSSNNTGNGPSSSSSSASSSNTDGCGDGAGEESDTRNIFHPSSPTHPSLSRWGRGNSKRKLLSLNGGQQQQQPQHGMHPASGSALSIVPPTPARGSSSASLTGQHRSDNNHNGSSKVKRDSGTGASGASGSGGLTTPRKNSRTEAPEQASTAPAGAAGGAASSSSPDLQAQQGASSSSVRALHSAQAAAEQAYYAAIPIAQEKGMRKGLVPLLASGYVHKSGAGISHFLRLCGHELCIDSETGDYLGDEGRSPEEQVLSKEVRQELFGGISFAGLPFDAALRIMLTKSGFRLPGEAQKIDRITQAFARAYFEDNRPLEMVAEVVPSDGDGNAAGSKTKQPPSTAGDPSTGSAAPVVLHSLATNDGKLHPASPDVVEILAFSCIMLNTDAHNPNIKKEKKMTKAQFVSNNRGIDKGANLPPEFLVYTYEAIVGNEIKMHAGSAAAAASASAAAAALAAAGQSSSGLVTSPAEMAARVCGAVPAVGGRVAGALLATHADMHLLPAGAPAVSTASTSAVVAPQSPKLLYGMSCGDGEATDGPTDASNYLKTLSTLAYRWSHHLSACAKADDKRGAVEDRLMLLAQGVATDGSSTPAAGGATPADSSSGNSNNSSSSSPVFYPVPYKKAFSVTTVSCAVEDLWPHIIAFATALLRLQAPSSSSLSQHHMQHAQQYSVSGDNLIDIGEGSVRGGEAYNTAGAGNAVASNVVGGGGRRERSGSSSAASASAANQGGGGAGFRRGSQPLLSHAAASSNGGSGVGGAGAVATDGSSHQPASSSAGADHSSAAEPPQPPTASSSGSGSGVMGGYSMGSLFSNPFSGMGLGGMRKKSGAVSASSASSAAAAATGGAGSTGAAGGGAGAGKGASNASGTPTAAGAHLSRGRSDTGGGADASLGSSSAQQMLVARLSSAPPSEIDLRLSALDALKFGTCAALFLCNPVRISQGADALLQVEAALLGVSRAAHSRDGPKGEAWHREAMEIARSIVATQRSQQQQQQQHGAASAGLPRLAAAGGSGKQPQQATPAVDLSVSIAEAVSLLHIAVAEMRDAAVRDAEAATLASTAARFKGELGKVLDGSAALLSQQLHNGSNGASGAPLVPRRLLCEGEMTKVASGGRGKHTLYRFFLFTDLLVYANKSAFSGKYTAHQAIPLTGMRVINDPPELCHVPGAGGGGTGGARSGDGGGAGGGGGGQSSSSSQPVGGGVCPPGCGFRLDTAVKPLYLFCSSEAEATDWKRNIREAAAALHRAQQEQQAREDAEKTMAVAQANAAAVAATTTGAAAAAAGSSGAGGAARSQPSTTAAAVNGGTATNYAGGGPSSPGGSSVTSHPSNMTTIGRAANAGQAFLAAQAAAVAASSRAADAAATEVAGGFAAVDGLGSGSISPPLPIVAPKLNRSAVAASSAAVAGAPPQLPSSAAASTPAAAVTPGPSSSSYSSKYESLPDLKHAFLQAVAFTRPLLSNDSTNSGNSNGSGTGSASTPNAAAGAGAPSSARRGDSTGTSANPPLVQSPGTATGALSDTDKLRFYGLFKQGTAGDCPFPAHDDDVSMMLPPAAGSVGGPSPRVPTSASTAASSSAGAAGAPHLYDAAHLAVAKAKRDAWLGYAGLRRRDAMRRFVELLDDTVPGWEAATALQQKPLQRR